MQVFETKITVTKDDIDELNHVNNVRYIQWVNDVAKIHWQHNTTKEIIDNYLAAIPLNRMGTVKDVANLCIFLASDEAGYITGQTIQVDGGLIM